MKENKFEFSYEVYDNISELNEKDAWLLTEARGITEQAYAPYSKFHVGAVAMLENGKIVENWPSVNFERILSQIM